MFFFLAIFVRVKRVDVAEGTRELQPVQQNAQNFMGSELTGKLYDIVMLI